MALVIVKLKGGPSNGVELGYNVPPPLPKSIDYVGSIYDKQPNTSKPVLYDYNFDKSNAGLKASHLHHGWNSLRRTMNTRAPKTVQQVQRDAHAALRAVGRGRKVRG